MVEEVKWRSGRESTSGGSVWKVRRDHLQLRDVKAVVSSDLREGARSVTLRLFNANLEGNARRAIDIHEGDKIDEKALKALIRAAVALNISARANSG